MIRFQPSLCCWALLGLLSCQTQVRQAEVIHSEAELSFLEANRAWEVVQDGRVVGSVVEFEEGQGERRFFSVRNARHQELGMVDVLGRAYRYRAHADEPEWLGTGTVIEGTQGILDLEAMPELYEVPLQLLRSDDPR